MTEIVRTGTEEEIGLIVADNPPVNALSTDVRKGLIAAIEKLEADEAIGAIVLLCAGRTFFAGADIREFSSAPVAPWLPDVIDRIEACAKPVVAALHGTALGGGFEVALGCHFRIADQHAKMGLPEVKLGVLPGAGGTQRLPRLIGPMKAADMIVSGEPIGAQAALDLGIIDQMAKSGLRAEAIAFARRVFNEKMPVRRLSQANEKIRGAGLLAEFDAHAETLLARKKGIDAPAACVRSVRNSMTMPFVEGARAERHLFLKLKDGEQSLAQRHIFFAERAAQKIAGLPKETKPAEVRSVAIIGAGTMGGGIAMCFANAGIPVTLIDSEAAGLERGLKLIRANYERSSSSKSGQGVEARMWLIRGETSLEAAANADLVIEAVFEDMALKKSIFADLGRIAKAGAVLATNTSTLDVNAIAEASGRPQSVVGMHFFSPANVMRLLEVVRGAKTGDAALATASATAARIGKIPVTVGVCYGFAGNRMLHARGRQVEALLLEGASPAQIDAALTGFGFAMGPCAVGDLAGLDIGWRARKQAGLVAPIADALCEMGRFGQKTGAGYYRYAPGARKGEPDPLVDELIGKIARSRDVARQPVSAEAVFDRLVYPMINEGARILAEGIAARAGDIDVIWVHGYGWPVQRGGPMFLADRQGMSAVRDRLTRLAASTGDTSLKPCALIEELAAGGRRFADLAS